MDKTPTSFLVQTIFAICFCQTAFAQSEPTKDWGPSVSSVEDEAGLLFPRAVSDLLRKQSSKGAKHPPESEETRADTMYRTFPPDVIGRINSWSVHIAQSQTYAELPPGESFPQEKGPPQKRTAVFHRQLAQHGRWLENVRDQYQTIESWQRLTDELLRFEVARAQVFPNTYRALVTETTTSSQSHVADVILVRALALSYLSSHAGQEVNPAHAGLDAFYESAMGFPINKDYLDLMTVMRRIYLWERASMYEQFMQCPSIQTQLLGANGEEKSSQLSARLADEVLGEQGQGSRLGHLFRSINHLAPTQIFRPLAGIIRSQESENSELAATLADLHIYLAVSFSRENLDLTLWPFIKDGTLDIGHMWYREAAYTNWLGFVFDHLDQPPVRNGDGTCLTSVKHDETLKCFGSGTTDKLHYLDLLSCMILDGKVLESFRVELPWFKRQQRVYDTPSYSRGQFAAFCEQIVEKIRRLDESRGDTFWSLLANVKVYQLLSDWLNAKPDSFGLTLTSLATQLRAGYPGETELDSMKILEKFGSSKDCFVRPEHLAQLQKPISWKEVWNAAKAETHILNRYSFDEKFLVDWLPAEETNHFRQASLRRLSRTQDLPFHSQLTRPNLPKVSYNDSARFDSTAWLTHVSRALHEAAQILSKEDIQQSEDVQMFLADLTEISSRHRAQVVGAAPYRKPLTLAMSAFLGFDTSDLIHTWLFGEALDPGKSRSAQLTVVAIVSDQPIPPLGITIAKKTPILFAADLMRARCFQDLVFAKIHPSHCFRITLPSTGEYSLPYGASDAEVNGNPVISGPSRLVTCNIQNGTIHCL